MKKPGGKSFGGKRFSDDKKSGGKFGKSSSGKKPFVKREGGRSEGDSEFKPRRRFNESGGDKPFKKSYGDKKPYGDRERSSGDKPFKKSYGDKKPYGDRERSSGDKPFKKSYGDKKPYGDRERSSGDKPFKKSYGDKKPYGDRERSSGDKPFKKSYGDKKPYGDRERSSGDKPFKKSYGDKKPYGDRERSSGDKPFKKSYGDKKPYGDRERSYGDKPFKKSYGDKKPYGDRERSSGDKPFKKSYGDKKPYGDRERSYGDKPFKKSYGDKKPYGDRERSSGDKPFKKSYGDKKPYGDRERSSGKEEKPFGNKSYGEDYKGFRKHEDMRRMKEELGEDWKTFDNPEEAHEYVNELSKKHATRKRTTGKTTGIAGPEDTIRLNRYIANTGVCSRREADDLISAGAVKVNGKIVTELGTKIGPGDVVHYGDQLLRREQLSYVLLNKPKDYITTTDDPQERKTVMTLVEGAGSERIYPVGRLDRQTTGLLLLTNDGDLAERLMHPKYGVRKLYHVTLDKNLRKEDFDAILTGLDLDDGYIKADELDYVGDGADKKQVGISLHSGRNRIVRRLFEHFGYDVISLDRVVYAGLTKKNLPRGRWRHLEPSEVGMLKMQVGGVKKKTGKKSK